MDAWAAELRQAISECLDILEAGPGRLHAIREARLMAAAERRRGDA